MSAKREKQTRHDAKACEECAARCEAAAVRTSALVNQAQAEAGNYRAFAVRLARRERTAREEKLRKLQHATAAGLLLVGVLSGSALTMSIWPHLQPESEAVVADPVLVGATLASTIELAPVPTVSPYSEEVPLTKAEQGALKAAAAEFGIPYPLALAVVDVESDFRNIHGDGGDSIGYMQVQPRWHQERMEQLGVTDLNDPASNFRVGLSYLSELMDEELTIHQVLMCYNLGPSGAAACWSGGQMESAYSREVVNRTEYWTSILA